jgi:hypothetical protein
MIKKLRQASQLWKVSRKRLLHRSLPLNSFASVIFLPVFAVLVHPAIAVVWVSHIATRAQAFESVFRLLVLSARASLGHLSFS